MKQRLMLPVSVAILALLLAIAFPLRREMMAPRIRSLAALPFENVSGDAGQGYFADGATEELIRELRRLQGLRVFLFCLPRSTARVEECEGNFP